MRLGELTATQDVLVFRAGGYTCAIASEEIVELLLMPALMRLPGQPAILDGFVNLRGVATPVVPLHYLFQQQPPEPDLYTPVIVMRTSGGVLALRVDSLEEVCTVDEGLRLACAKSDSFNEWAEAQFQRDGQDVAILSPERLLLMKERECVADLRAQMQRRLEHLEAPPG